MQRSTVGMSCLPLLQTEQCLQCWRHSSRWSCLQQPLLVGQCAEQVSGPVLSVPAWPSQPALGGVCCHAPVIPRRWPHPTVPLSVKVSVWGALWSLVVRGREEVCMWWCPCSSAQQHGTVCGVAAIDECSVVQWEAHIVCRSSQCDVAA